MRGLNLGLLEVNDRIAGWVFAFLELDFDDCAAQFKELDFPPSDEAPTFLDVDKMLGRVPKDLLSFLPK